MHEEAEAWESPNPLSRVTHQASQWQSHSAAQPGPSGKAWPPTILLNLLFRCLGVLGRSPKVISWNKIKLQEKMKGGMLGPFCLLKVFFSGNNTILILINHVHFEHRLLWAQFLQSLQWLWMPLLATGTLIERQRRHQFKLPWTPFLRDLGHPNHPPKPF